MESDRFRSGDSLGGAEAEIKEVDRTSGDRTMLTDLGVVTDSYKSVDNLGGVGRDRQKIK